jgi:hypothetical protein
MKEQYKTIIQGVDYCKLLDGQCPSSQLEYVLCNWILDLQSQLQQEREKSIRLPMKGNHKLFEDVTIVGMRIECTVNNNTMYLIKTKGEYYWVYDYETELTQNQSDES